MGLDVRRRLYAQSSCRSKLTFDPTGSLPSVMCGEECEKVEEKLSHGCAKHPRLTWTSVWLWRRRVLLLPIANHVEEASVHVRNSQSTVSTTYQPGLGAVDARGYHLANCERLRVSRLGNIDRTGLLYDEAIHPSIHLRQGSALTLSTRILLLLALAAEQQRPTVCTSGPAANVHSGHSRLIWQSPSQSHPSQYTRSG